MRLGNGQVKFVPLLSKTPISPNIFKSCNSFVMKSMNNLRRCFFTEFSIKEQVIKRNKAITNRHHDASKGNDGIFQQSILETFLFKK